VKRSNVFYSSVTRLCSTARYSTRIAGYALGTQSHSIAANKYGRQTARARSTILTVSVTYLRLNFHVGQIKKFYITTKPI